MSSQFISILLEFFWILYRSQMHLLRTSNELLKHYPNTVGMQDPAMTTVSSLPAHFRPTQKSSGTSGTKALRYLWASLAWFAICNAQCDPVARHLILSKFHPRHRSWRFTAGHPGYAWMYLDVISLHLMHCQFNLVKKLMYTSYEPLVSASLCINKFKSVYSARDRWSKHQYLVSKHI